MQKDSFKVLFVCIPSSSLDMLWTMLKRRARTQWYTLVMRFEPNVCSLLTNQLQVGMMKLFQHANIQPCLAAFAAGMEVLVSHVDHSLKWCPWVYSTKSVLFKVWLVTPLMPYGSVADLIKGHFQGETILIICSVTPLSFRMVCRSLPVVWS